MRDVEKLREKVELSLDDRQIAGLAFAALLLLGGVFALGLMVGKTLAARAPVAQAGDLASLDDAQEREAAKPAALKAPVKAPDVPVKVASPVPSAVPASEPVAEEPAAPKPVAHPAPVAVAVAPPERKPVAVDAPPKAAAAVHSTREIVLTSPPRDLAAFTIQIGASQEKADAQRLESRARGAGLKPYVVEAQLPNKGTWYRVRVGSFKDKDAANRFRKDVERELRQSAVVMPTH